MAAKTSFYTEDTVSLKADPSIIGVVESTWRDVDSPGYSRPSEWIPHTGVSETTTKRSTREGQPAVGYVVIRFELPDTGCALIREDDLLLLDRALTIGDVVKRRPTDAESGMVLKAFETCLIEPLYTALYTANTLLPNPLVNSSIDNGKILVPAEELCTLDFEEGDRVIFQDWIGEIEDTNVEVTVRLGNGNIVTVDDIEKLEIADCPRQKLRDHPQQDLVSKLKQSRKKRLQATHHTSDLLAPAMQFWPGQTVFTTKANLRLGTWRVGRYNANEPPRGIVVDTRVTSIQVRWIATKLFDNSRSSLGKPPTMIEQSDLDKVRRYNDTNFTSSHQAFTSNNDDVFTSNSDKVFTSNNDENLTSNTDDDLISSNDKNFTSSGTWSSNDFGTRVMHDTGAGDVVRFRDIAGAALKYSEDSPHKAKTGVFKRIPKTAMDGFDMNVFLVKTTTTKVRIQWQNGAVTEELAADLIPYLNVDDHDVWPGEIVSVKSEEVHNDEGLIALKKVGVVQTVDALERTARIRWFSNPSVSVFKDQTSVLFSGADLGLLTDEDEASSLPLFDIMAYSALSKRRGDLVVLAPNSSSQAIHTAAALIMSSQNGRIPKLPDLRGSDPNVDPQDILSADGVRWFGEIVDLRLDGLLVVRLGALDKVEDILVPIQRVNVAIGGDDPYDIGSDSGSDSLMDSESFSDMSEHSHMAWDEAEEIIEETFYEGGERLDDDGNEDDWMTDGSDSDGSNGSNDSNGPNGPNGSNGSNGSVTKDSEKADPDIFFIPPENAQAGSPTNKTTDGDEADNQEPTELDSAPQNGDHSLFSHLDFDSSIYLSMPPQFDVLDDSPISHNFLTSPGAVGSSFLRQLRLEHKILSTSLPGGIWVRTWSGRSDLFQVLILGPRGTPYAMSPFLFDFQLPSDYPNSPPHAYFHSWTNNIGRINPNLYEDGNICLSILGTWHHKEVGEGWNRSSSNLLQVLVSLLGLVLVEQPYYNEAGFDALVGAEETTVPARIYAEKALCMSKGFVEHALNRGCGVLADVANWLYRDSQGPKLTLLIVDEAHELLNRRKQEKSADTNTGSDAESMQAKKPLSAGAEALLRRYLPGLESIAEQVRMGDKDVSK